MRILIVEDEPQTAQILKDIVLQVNPEAQVLGITESIQKTIAFLTKSIHYPDLIFMDIHLADGSSFEVFSHLKVHCPVVFCTAYDQYALQAFKANGIDYLLKPVTESDVKAAFEKFERLKPSVQPDADLVEMIQQLKGANKKYKTSILVHYRDSFIPLTVANIAVFVLENELLYAYTFENTKYPMAKSLDDLEHELNPDDFYRINRQAIINRKAITLLQPYFNRKVIIKTPINLGDHLIVSRLKVSGFMKWIEQA